MGKKFVVSARLEAEDRASKVIGRVEGRFRRLGDFVKSRLVITMGDAARAIGAAFREIERVASLQSQTDALKLNLATQGVAFDGFIAKLKQVSDAQVATSTLIEASGKALLLGIPADKIAELMDVARVSSIATGDSIKKSFEDIVVGVGRASPMILDNLGIVVKLQDAYDTMAAEVGTTSTELTAQQKKLALLNAVLETGRDRVEKFGDAQSELSKRLNQGTTAMQEFKDASGKALGNLGLLFGGILTKATASISFIGANLAGVIAQFAKLLAFLPLVGDKFEELSISALRLSSRMAASGKKTFELGIKMNQAAEAGLNAQLGITKAADAAGALGDAAKGAAGSLDAAGGAAFRLTASTAELGARVKDLASAYEQAIGSAKAFGAVTSVELESQILDVQIALLKQKEILGDTSAEYRKLAEVAESKMNLMRERADNLRRGLGDLNVETQQAARAFDSYGQSLDVASVAADRFAVSTFNAARAAAAANAQASNGVISGRSRGRLLRPVGTPLFPGFSGSGTFTTIQPGIQGRG